MLILLAWLLLCYCGVGNIHCATVHENNVDLHSLLDFKHGITNDPSGATSNWTLNTHFCHWNGVSCTLKRPWRVTKLNLASQSLTGTISSSLGNLTFLNTLDLSFNNFIGPFPLFTNLQQLQTLYLYNNYLEGNIPDALANCSNLSDLDLSSNSVVGAIPLNFDSLSNLTSLNLAGNNLTGTIPPTLGNITTLLAIFLDQNQLEGMIPDKLWQLPKLLELTLGANRFSGELPQTLANVSSLQALGLEFNRLGKVLPRNIGDEFPNLQQLGLNGNMFDGNIPASLGNISQLGNLSLDRNNFIGSVPSSLGRLSSLAYLNLEDNNLEARDIQSWEFLHALRNCTLLGTLSLAKNQFEGEIPDSIGNLSPNLQYLVLSANKLSGPVPLSIGNLRSLNKLSLDFNTLTGTIEGWVGKLTNLVDLNLEANNLSGSMPSSIGDLTNLTLLSLATNSLDGLIPSSLGNLSKLLKLDLSYNNFQGVIPPDISNLKQLTNLSLSRNKLIGEIPGTLGQCKALVALQLSQNFFTGVIPLSLADLINLVTLNLSHNSLSGTIPQNLNDLPLLNKLDLSCNRLQGKIPMTGVFANATSVYLDGNTGLCGGVTDLHMPSCKARSRRTERLYYLIKVLAPIFGFLSLALLVYFLVLEKKPREKHISLSSLGENFLKVSYNDLAQATKNSESSLIGRGSYGSVYRGKLKEYKLEVAMKVFDLEMRGAERSFMAECEALRSIQHRNLLPILTACSTVDNMGTDFKALVYEYMPKGNLDTWIHPKENGKPPKRLSLAQTINICVNVADALDYLHYECGRTTIHCDLKPSNILLDEDMNALLGDFGIARFYIDWPTSTSSTSSIGVKGTIGYIAPEYAGGGRPSTCGDAYSFGIVLLELLTGKRPTDSVFKDGLDIVSFVDRNFPHQVFQAIDTRLTEECRDFDPAETATGNAAYQCLVSLLQIALSCTQQSPNERANMKQVANKLHAIKTLYLGSQTKQNAYQSD
ncbi:hypothetical protein EJB05_20773, partial [Eragrostis curvula]